MSTALTLIKRTSLPPKAITRVNLIAAAQKLRSMQTTVVVVIRDYGERDALRLRVQQLEAELLAATNAAAERAQREDRIKAVTIREVDLIAEWEAKQPKARVPQITLSSSRIVTADVWQKPQPES